MRTLVIIPTYNERDNLAWIIGRLRTAVPDAAVLVVDDNSPDGTGDCADLLAAADPQVRVLHREGKEGLGAAYRDGMRWGLVAGFDAIVEMDADGSHQPEQLPRVLDRLADSDVVVGSRWVTGGRIENWPLRRQLLSRGGSAYARFALGIGVRDMTSGFRVFTSDALNRIDLDAVISQGYCFQIDMLWHAAKIGLRIAEVPITFVERVRGSSKMSGGIALEAMARVTGWAMRSLPARIRRRVVRASMPTEAAVEHEERLRMFSDSQ